MPNQFRTILPPYPLPAAHPAAGEEGGGMAAGLALKGKSALRLRTG